jgi:hypothetical protein
MSNVVKFAIGAAFVAVIASNYLATRARPTSGSARAYATPTQSGGAVLVPPPKSN